MAHHIVPGSFEMDDDGIIQAGVHTGPSEWEMNNVRYVRVDAGTAEPGETVFGLLVRTYKNSTGCLINHDFRMKEQEAWV